MIIKYLPSPFHRHKIDPTSKMFEGTVIWSGGSDILIWGECIFTMWYHSVKFCIGNKNMWIKL